MIKIQAGFYSNTSVDLAIKDIKTYNPSILAYNTFTKDYAIFTDEMFTNQQLNITVILPGLGYNIAIVELYNISEQFFNYLYSLEKVRASKSSFSIETGFTGQSTPVTMFTNIENGYGIFAGYSMDRDSIFGIPYPDKK